MATSSCARCATALDNALACAQCGALLELSDGANAFEVLGLEPTWEISPTRLKQRVLTLSRLVHPDFFAAAPPAVRDLAQRNAAELNRAHEQLASDGERAELLIRMLDGPDETRERQLPQAFLLDVLEWSEALEQARAARDSANLPDLANLRQELDARRAECLRELGGALAPLPPRQSPRLTEARRALNALRYLERALRELEELRLASPPTKSLA